MGMGMNAAGSMAVGLNQPEGANSYQPNFGVGQNIPNQNQQNQQTLNNAQVDPTEKLIQMKKLLDAGVISQEEFDKVKSDLLGF